MSDITKAIQSILPEVTVDTKGVVSISRYGLTELIKMEARVLTPAAISKKLVESLSAVGFEICAMTYGETIPDTAIACIIEYFAFDAQRTSPIAQQLYRAFGAMGIRKFFQAAKGWTETANKPQSNVDRLSEIISEANKLLEIYKYAEDKPGLKAIVNEAGEIGDKSLPGYITVQDVLDQKNIVLTGAEKSAIGMYAATQYRNFTGKKPSKRKVVRRDSSGRLQYTYVSEYPVEFAQIIENALNHGFKSK